MSLASLGEPHVAISQELAFVTPSDDQISVDEQNRCVNVDLTEADTMALAENVRTQCQIAFVYEDDNVEPGEEPIQKVTRFPVHEISVATTLMGSLL